MFLHVTVQTQDSELKKRSVNTDKIRYLEVYPHNKTQIVFDDNSSFIAEEDLKHLKLVIQTNEKKGSTVNEET
jgi:hypothetical protein